MLVLSLTADDDDEEDVKVRSMRSIAAVSILCAAK